MSDPKQQDTDAERSRRQQEQSAPDADEKADALNDARALQQMIEGTPDSSDEFRRIEQKR
jgi:hypothetical protein